jgi:hypothetical protein
VRKTARVQPWPALYEQQAGPVFRALVQRCPLGSDDFRRNHGKFRVQPRRRGSGRHRNCAWSAFCGHPIVRHPSKLAFKAAGSAPLAGADGRRGDTK